MAHDFIPNLKGYVVLHEKSYSPFLRAEAQLKQTLKLLRPFVFPTQVTILNNSVIIPQTNNLQNQNFLNIIYQYLPPKRFQAWHTQFLPKIQRQKEELAQVLHKVPVTKKLNTDQGSQKE